MKTEDKIKHLVDNNCISFKALATIFFRIHRNTLTNKIKNDRFEQWEEDMVDRFYYYATRD